jgi:erythromycin esterase
MVMDPSVRKVGERSLRIERRGAGTAPQARVESPVAIAHWLVERAGTRRDALARATSPTEADWTIQNLRVVEQCARMNAAGYGVGVRDSSMAANVDWILAHEPKGARIVLWAHNGHVARSPGWMGAHLGQRHGADMVVIGFAAFEGQYTAIRQRAGLRSDNELTRPTIECFESLAQATGLPRFVLDLRRRGNDAAGRWFSSPRAMRSIGSMAMDAQFHPAELARDYDALVFVSRTTATRPVGAAR